jgi:hypothetical protein
MITAAWILGSYRQRHAYDLTFKRTAIVRAFTGSDDSAWKTQLSLLPETFRGPDRMEALIAFATFCREKMTSDNLDTAAAATVHLAALISRIALELENSRTYVAPPPTKTGPTASLEAIGAFLAIPIKTITRNTHRGSTHPTPGQDATTNVPPETFLLPESPSFIAPFERAISINTLPHAFEQALTRDHSLMPLTRDIQRTLESYSQALNDYNNRQACSATMVQIERIKREIVTPPPIELPQYLQPEQKTELQTKQLSLPYGGTCPGGGTITAGPYGRWPTCSKHGPLNTR